MSSQTVTHHDEYAEERTQRAKELLENQRYIDDKLSKIIEPMIINVLNNRHIDPVSQYYI